jgi:hypothetical protein
MHQRLGAVTVGLLAMILAMSACGTPTPAPASPTNTAARPSPTVASTAMEPASPVPTPGPESPLPTSAESGESSPPGAQVLGNEKNTVSCNAK